jgi:hypothetical protein
MQSIFGALLTAGYATAAAASVAASNQSVSDSVQNQLTKSFAGAEAIAKQNPQYADQITAAAKAAFLDGDQWAYLAGVGAVVLGAVIVFFCFPRRDRERALLAGYEAEDRAPAAAAAPPQPAAV